MARASGKPSFWRRETLAWCCYDWANSGYTTLFITVFVVYLQQVVFDSQTSGMTGAVVWAWSVSVSMLAGAVLSPVIGAVADARAGKRTGLALSAFGGSLACLAMAVVPSSQTVLIVTCLVVANICLQLSVTLYNGFLPEIASDAEINRLSAAGMGCGYLGGGLALLLAMLLLNYATSLGDSAVRLRVCIFLTGVWWAVFTLPTVWILRDRPRSTVSATVLKAAGTAFHDVMETFRKILRNRVLLWFLIAFLVYNDGVQTVISQASTFALQELKFTDRGLVAVVLMVQFVATPGAILVGWMADRFGRQQALVVCLVVWIGLLVSAWFVRSQTHYWFMAAGVALVLGGTQAVSRAIMGSLTPRGQEARYFGFFNLSGKATSFLGTFFFGLIVAMTGSARLSIVNLLVFFTIGLWIIMRLKLPDAGPTR
jgi:UMF1 family MFS transporter